jgi:hypothetical protein
MFPILTSKNRPDRARINSIGVGQSGYLASGEPPFTKHLDGMNLRRGQLCMIVFFASLCRATSIP